MNEQPAPDASANSEPLLTVGGITTVATVILSLVVAFGVPVSDDVRTSLVALVAILAPIVVALWGRGRVYAEPTVARLLSAARLERAGTPAPGVRRTPRF